LTQKIATCLIGYVKKIFKIPIQNNYAPIPICLAWGDLGWRYIDW